MGEKEKEVSRCEILDEVFETMLASECTYPLFVKILGKYYGIENASEEMCNDVLQKGLDCKSIDNIIKYIFCKALKIMDEKNISFKEAVKLAKEEVEKACGGKS